MPSEKPAAQGFSGKGNQPAISPPSPSRLAAEQPKRVCHAQIVLHCGPLEGCAKIEKPLYLSHLTPVEEVTEDDGIDYPIHENGTVGISHGTRLVAMDIDAGLSNDASCPHDEEVWRSADDFQQTAVELAHPVSLTPNSFQFTMELPLSLNVTRAALDEKLLAFRRNNRNLVLDSLCPDTAPHIVITPPEDRSEDYFIPFENAIELQSPYYLSVPPASHSFFASSCPPPSDISCDSTSFEQGTVANTPMYTNDSVRAPQAVFSPSSFLRSVERSSAERLVMFYVCTAVQRLHCRYNAFAATRKALALRERYDSPEYIQSLEKPFQWSDPAEPLLLASKYIKGTTIIESDWPCSVPHIMINEPPPQSPWIAWQNATTDPQYSGFGMYLTVPSRWVLRTECLEDYDDDESPCSYWGSDSDLLDVPTRPDSPEPTTPNDGSPFCPLPQFLCPEEFVGTCSENASIACADVIEAIPTGEVSSTDAYHVLFDEDEGLPPLDGWCMAYLHLIPPV